MAMTSDYLRTYLWVLSLQDTPTVYDIEHPSCGTRSSYPSFSTSTLDNMEQKHFASIPCDPSLYSESEQRQINKTIRHVKSLQFPLNASTDTRYSLPLCPSVPPPFPPRAISLPRDTSYSIPSSPSLSPITPADTLSIPELDVRGRLASRSATSPAIIITSPDSYSRRESIISSHYSAVSDVAASSYEGSSESESIINNLKIRKSSYKALHSRINVHNQTEWNYPADLSSDSGYIKPELPIKGARIVTVDGVNFEIAETAVEWSHGPFTYSDAITDFFHEQIST